MKLEDIEKVGVIGAGTMGPDIAYVFAKAGFEVWLFDQTKEIAQKAKEKIAKILKDQLVKRAEEINENVTDAKTAKIINSCKVLDRIHPDISDPHNSECDFFNLDFVIEAVSENLSTKKDIFDLLDTYCRFGIILATNTSSLKIKDIAKAVCDSLKPKVIGMHFMNPPHKNKELEIVINDDTSPETFELVYNLAKKIGRKPIIVSKDIPGFICNRNLMPSVLESLRCLEDGVGSAEDIDKSIMIGVGGAMGPLSLGDLIGWDIVLEITKVLHRGFGLRFNPPKILFDLVKNEYLGRKKGKGIFDFNQGRKNES